MRFFLCAFVLSSLLLVSCSKSKEEKSGATASTAETSMQQIPAIAIRLDSTKYFFEGAIGESAFVNAELSFHQSVVQGSYRYYAGSRALSLKGSIQADYTVQLVERDDQGRGGWEKDTNQTVSGRLIGKLDIDKGVLTGTWTSKDGKKSLPFSLKALGTFKVFKHGSLDVACDYPHFSLPELNAMNDTLAQMTKKTYESAVASIDTMRQEYLQEEDMKDRAGYLSEHTFANVVYASSRLLSLVFHFDSYTGGAHGNYGFQSMTWKIEQGMPRRIQLAELFQTNSNYAKVISDILVQKLKKEEASSVVDGSITNFTDDIQKELLDFTLHPSGITFYFAPYAVASYAEGAFEIHIPWKQLESVLRPNMLSELFSKSLSP